MHFSAEIIAVGTELLLGDIVNTNAQFLSQKLAELGVSVYRQAVIGDNPGRLRIELKKALSESNIVILTGGLGPTKDDLTKETVCEALGFQMELSEPHLEKMRQRFKDRGSDMPESNKKQAMFPKEAFILENDHGTAPGCILSAGPQHIVMLPGPPYEMKPMFEHYAIPYLKQFLSAQVIASKSLEFFGIGESALAERLGDLLDNENPTVAPYAAKGQCRIRVSARADTEAAAGQMIDTMVERIKIIAGEYIYSFEGKQMEETAVALLQKAGKTVAVAESLTGGLITERLTNVPGASQVLAGGFCTYTAGTKAKILDLPRRAIKKYGTVSAPVAAAMAASARRHAGAHLGLSATGVAGPGLDEKGNPVGTVFVALCDGKHTYVKQLQLGHLQDRDTIRYVTATHALDLARRWCDEDERHTLQEICIPEKQVKKIGNGFFRRAARRLFPVRGDSVGLVMNKLLFIACFAAVITVSVFTVRYYIGLQDEGRVNAMAVGLIGTAAQGELPEGFLAEYGGLYDLNGDFAGFVSVDGLRLPLVQGVDNIYYLTHNFLKQEGGGTCFVDYRNGVRWLSDQTVLYANELLTETMRQYAAADYMDGHLSLSLDMAYGSRSFAAVAAVYANVDKSQGRVFRFDELLNRTSDDEMDAYLAEVYQRAVVRTSLRVHADDKLLAVVMDGGEYAGQKLIVYFRELREGESTLGHIAYENTQAVRDDRFYLSRGESVPTEDLPFSDTLTPPPDVQDSSSASSDSEQSGQEPDSSTSASSSGSHSSSGGTSQSSSGSMPSSSSSSSSSSSGGDSSGGDTHPYGMANMSGVGEVDMAEAVARCTALETGGSLAPEAVKAQAVAIHTYILYCNSRGRAADLMMYNNETAAQRALIERVKTVVMPVMGGVLRYGGSIIYSPFFSSAAGRTNSNQETFGGALPYLQSVESKYDYLYARNWESTLQLTEEQVRKAAAANLPGADLSGDPAGWFVIESHTSGGYVSAIRVGGVSTTGRALRERILTGSQTGAGVSLRSHCFTVSYQNGVFTFTAKGYGHGVGMSQYGAHGYALQEGWSYSQILNHYYRGAVIANG